MTVLLVMVKRVERVERVERAKTTVLALDSQVRPGCCS
jgi:hypothetical protein